jgi:S-layer homology domain
MLNLGFAAHNVPALQNEPNYTRRKFTFCCLLTSNIFFAFIETAYHDGVINGYPDHTFRPNNNIRRDEMAQIVYKGVTTP